MIVLGIGELAATSESGNVISTRLMGSRVAVLCYCAFTGAVGMVHIAFPRSSMDPVQALVMPGIYADTGVEALMRRFRPLCDKSFFEISAVIVWGGADPGEWQNAPLAAENANAAAKALTGLGLKYSFELSEGAFCRTVDLEGGTGCIRITTANAQPRTNIPVPTSPAVRSTLRPD
jgi:chemotaxis receptor (MCP) glutamine deamidase CheD